MDLHTCSHLLKQSYHRTAKRSLSLGNLTAAAVLVPLYTKNGETHVLFIKRTLTVRHHKGQISFPGGARDEEDPSLLDTALRETHEEVGIEPAKVAPLAEMDDMVTPTGFRVTPFAGVIPYPIEFAINPHETDSVIEIPLSHLMNPANHRLGYRKWQDKTYEVHYFDYRSLSVWGVTGVIVHDMVERLKAGLQL